MATLDANAKQTSTALVPQRKPGFNRGINGPWLIVILLAPSLALLIGIIFYPVFNTILLSFQSLNLAIPFLNHWVGLANYVKILTNPIFDFWHSVGFSALFSVASTALAFMIGFAFALLLNQRLRFQLLWRGPSKSLNSGFTLGLSASYSTWTAPAAAFACSRVSATTTATYWPQ